MSSQHLTKWQRFKIWTTKYFGYFFCFVFEIKFFNYMDDLITDVNHHQHMYSIIMNKMIILNGHQNKVDNVYNHPNR